MSEPNVNAIPMARQKGNVKQMVSLAMICSRRSTPFCSWT